MSYPVAFPRALARTLAVFVVALLSLSWPSMADMQASEIEVACNSLARMAFDLKDLVETVKNQRNPGPFQDVLDEFNDIFESCLSNISVMVGSAEVTDVGEQQLVYESYSNFVQGLFELMDVVTDSASTLIVLDKQAEFRVPAAVHEVSGVVDALLFQVMAVYPPSSSFYIMQSQNQKSQVDTHFRQAIHAFHLATAGSGSPYSNTTTI